MLKVKNKSALLKKVNDLLADHINRCSLCPRRCLVDRKKGQVGYCRAGHDVKIYNHFAHHGEEPPISGIKGSGTIFFSYCSMRCAYCQNYYFSQLGKGENISVSGLADIMLGLQNDGCHNINLVSPTHYLPQIVNAMLKAVGKGFNIPIVYNTSGYEDPKILRLLDGAIDIYLADMRYSQNKMAAKYSDALNYVEYNRQSIIEMQRQVGDLVLDDSGIASKGLIIRLLALPEDISGTCDSLNFIKHNVSHNTYLSIMSQYYPTYKAYDYKEISRRVNSSEYKFIIDEAALLGLNNGWIQDISPSLDPKHFGTSINSKK